MRCANQFLNALFSWYASLVLFVYCGFFLPFLYYGFSVGCFFFDLPVEVYHLIHLPIKACVLLILT